jgi:transcriptional regulator with XRE-family HTH domain
MRLAKKLTQKELAEKTKLSMRFVSKMESDPQNLSLDTLELLANALGVSQKEIFAGWISTEDSKEDIAIQLHALIDALKSK